MTLSSSVACDAALIDSVTCRAELDRRMNECHGSYTWTKEKKVNVLQWKLKPRTTKDKISGDDKASYESKDSHAQISSSNVSPCMSSFNCARNEGSCSAFFPSKTTFVLRFGPQNQNIYILHCQKKKSKVHPDDTYRYM